MRSYPIPPDTKEKEKTVGGIFTKTQFIFVIASTVFGLLFGYLGYQFSGNAIVFFICFIIGFVPFVPFWFIKIRRMGDIELIVYLIRKYRFNHSIKNYVNISENYQPIVFADDDGKGGLLEKFKWIQDILS